ncbi:MULTISPECIES: hypothetical protein [Ramlibacter]|nr:MULTISPECIES: hypothetical protein [Ramlibacter]
MTLPPLTFAQLKNVMIERSRSGDAVSASSLPNAMSALVQFMAERGFRDDSLIGTHLRASYYKQVAAHVKALREEGRPGAYIRNRKSLVKQWRALVLELDRQAAAQGGTETPLQRALRELLDGGLPLKTVASRARVPHASLKRWLRGSLPQRGKLGHLQSLERFFGQPPGTLTDLLPIARPSAGSESASEAEPPKIAYRARLGEQIKLKYRLKDPCETLVKEWKDFLLHKTSLTASGLKRQKRGKWNTTSRPVKPEDKVQWFESVTFLGQRTICQTAAITWTHFSQYVGWLSLAVESGGAGLPAEAVQSLASLLNREHLEAYIEWRVARAGGVLHRGICSILKLAASICHPVTGYLTQCRNRFPVHPDARDELAWNATCRSAHEGARQLIQHIESTCELSRDPSAPVAAILSLPNPLAAIKDATKRMDAVRPSTGGMAEAIWARDRLMVKLLTSNPLRAKNLILLTIAPSPSGEPAQLREVNGVWRIAIDKKDFKNLAGAAKDRAYDMPVRRELWSDIEAYRDTYRKMLASPSNPYLFVSSKSPDGPMYSLNRQFENISKRYFSDCPGVGPQTMRHIVATTILKMHPNAWAAAAYVLHDREETVRKNYAHLASDDAARWLDEMMTKALSGL